MFFPDHFIVLPSDLAGEGAVVLDELDHQTVLAVVVPLRFVEIVHRSNHFARVVLAPSESPVGVVHQGLRFLPHSLGLEVVGLGVGVENAFGSVAEAELILREGR